MKTLFQFLNEARVSQASQEAKKLNLTSDGHGSWRDSRGRVGSKDCCKVNLKMLTAQERAAEEGGKESKETRRSKSTTKSSSSTTGCKA